MIIKNDKYIIEFTFQSQHNAIIKLAISNIETTGLISTTVSIINGKLQRTNHFVMRCFTEENIKYIEKCYKNKMFL